MEFLYATRWVVDALLASEELLLGVIYSFKTLVSFNKRHLRLEEGLIASKNLHMKLNGFPKESRHHAHSLGNSTALLQERGRVTPKQLHIADRWY